MYVCIVAEMMQQRVLQDRHNFLIITERVVDIVVAFSCTPSCRECDSSTANNGGRSGRDKPVETILEYAIQRQRELLTLSAAWQEINL